MSLAPLNVAVPLGIGDTHWACTKFRGLSKLHGGRPIHAHVSRSSSHESVRFLEIVPFVAKAIENKRAPYDIGADLQPSWMDPRWSTVEGCRKWREFDYVLVPNGHLQRGERLDAWLPEVETEYVYDLRISDTDRARARKLVPPGSVLLYLSGTGPNAGFHRNTWTVDHWVDVVARLNSAGIEPYVIGANTPEDLGYLSTFAKASHGKFRACHSRVGETSIPVVCAIIEEASVWAGLNSGLGIVSAMRGTPTVMLWSDSRYPIRGAIVPLHTNMRTSWLPEERLSKYRTLSYGSPELTPKNVVSAILEVKR